MYETLAEALSRAIMLLFWGFPFVIVMVVPYIQTLIVLFLRWIGRKVS